jgi:hypothetical protein
MSGSSVLVALNALALKASRLPKRADAAAEPGVGDAPADPNALHAAG